MPLSAGDTFLMHGTGGIGNPSGAHLMVCLTVDRPNNTAVIVPIVSRHDLSDTSCVLVKGDHPFCTHESCASYDFARRLSLSEAEAKIAKGELKARAPVSNALLLRLQVGFVLSDETTPWMFQAGNGQALMAFLKHKGLIN